MNIFISPTKKTEWKIPLEKYLNFLQNIYANIKITKIENTNRKFIYEWETKNNDFYLEGKIGKELDCIVFQTNDIKKCKNFILGTRKYMPEDENILIYDENFENNILLLEDNWEKIENVF